MGRSTLLEAAADLLADADLATVAGAVVGVRSVAARAGVSPATVNHHFRPDGGGRNARLAAAAIHRALTRGLARGAGQVAADAVAAVEALQAGDPDALARLEEVAASDITRFHPDDPEPDPERDALNTAMHLAIAVAPRSAEARRALRDHYGTNTDIYSALYAELLRATGRRPLEGLDVRAFTIVLSALSDGFVIRRLFDDEQAPPSLFGMAVVRVFEALSTPIDAREDHDPADQLVPLPPGSHLDTHKRTAIARAAAEVYRADGWDGVTVTAVQHEAEVSRRTVIANFRDRDGLAAAIWSQFIPGLQDGIADDADLPVHRRVHRHLERLAAVVQEHRALTAAMFEGAFSFAATGVPLGTDPADPRMIVPLSQMLEPVLRDGGDAFRPGQVDGAPQVFDSALLLVSSLIQIAMNRPSSTPPAAATRVCDTVLAGMLRRRPTRW